MIKLNEFVKKYDKELFILGFVVIVLVMLFVTNAHSAPIVDTNDGTKGYILVNSGAIHTGTWTDPAFLKGATGATGLQGIQGLQGLKGDIGEVGLQGIQGLNGDTGIQGLQGFNGIDGLNGVAGNKGDIGLTGAVGQQGIQGIKGLDVDPTTVTNLQNTDNTLQNNINNTNARIDDVSNRVSKLERMQTKLQVGIRVYDSKRITVTPYISQNFTRGLVDEVGVRVTVKLGKSYEEKLIENTNQRVKAIETKLGVSPVIEKVVNEKGQTKSIRIIENGLAVDSQF